MKGLSQKSKYALTALQRLARAKDRGPVLIAELAQKDEIPRKFLELIRAYMRKGGFHIQFNIVDSRMLKGAQAEPDKFRSLLVRVAGFTQYWVELGKQIQDEVISRTEYEEL